MISLNNIDKVYKQSRTVNVSALDDVSFEIPEGKITALIGPSGSGKSTLLNILGGLDREYTGKILVGEKDLKKYNPDYYRRRVVGTIFQQFNLIASLSVAENITLPITFGRQLKGADLKRRLYELVQKVGLEHRINHKPSEISGGQAQRVAIARALIAHPKLLLADEPTGNLDSKTGMEIIELLERLNREDGTTIVIVTHDQNIMEGVNRKVFLRDGKVIDVIDKSNV